MAEATFRFTRHARNRLRLWKLTVDAVVGVLAEPDRTTVSLHGRWNAWKLVEERWLRVTYLEEDDTIVIITVTVRRQGPEEE